MARVDQLFNYLQTPGLSDQQIAAEINRLGVTAQEVSQLTGVPVADVQSRLAAVAITPTAAPTAAPPMPTAAPTAAPTMAPPPRPIITTPTPTAAPTAAPTMAPPPVVPTNLMQFQNYLQTPGLTDAQILAEMGRLGITNRNVSSITGVPVTDVENRVNALAPTLPFANATQGFTQDFNNYTSIAPGAQFAGGQSPYSRIMAQMTPVGNPYATARAGLPMGGYDPGIYDPNLLQNFIDQRAEDAAAARGEAVAADAAMYAAFDGGLITKVMGPNPPTPDDGTMFVQKGEYIIKRDSVDKYGKGLLDMINEGKIPAKKIKSLLD